MHETPLTASASGLGRPAAASSRGAGRIGSASGAAVAERVRSQLLAWPLALGAVLPLLAYVWWGDTGLSLQDEGFLWYGAQRVLSGEVPQRDFQAYDAARYHWPAAWMWLSGSDGIASFRAGHAVLAAACVVLATSLLRTGTRLSTGMLAVAAIGFWLWMVPYYKLADSLAVLVLVGGLSALFRSVTPRRWLLFGACLGVAATLGINHGLYGILAAGMAVGVLGLLDRRFVTPRSIGALLLGVLVGYAPVLLMHLAVPGYAASFIDGLRQLVEAGTTNLERSLPSLDALAATGTGGARRTLWESLFAIEFWAAAGVLSCGVVRVIAALRAGDASVPPLFLAAVLVAVPYTHYVLSRADLVHLTVSILPILLIAWAWPVRRAMAWHRVALVAVAASGVIALPEHAGYPAWRGMTLETVDVRGDRLRLRSHDAEQVRLVRQLTDLHAPSGRAFYAAPYSPGAYALEGRRSPVWEIYALFPSRPERQLQEIDRLATADIGFALLTLDPVDGRVDLGFERTHPLIVQHLARCLHRADAMAHASANVRVLVPGARPCLD